MASNINRETYMGSKPAWHHLGIDAGGLFSADELLDRLPRYAYRVEKVPQFVHWRGEEVPTGAYATIRTDTDEVLGTVGPTYQVVQNVEAFKPFDQLCGPDHAFYTSVGVLGKGETIFLVAKLPDSFYINEDPFDKYLTLTNNHSGRNALRVYTTTVRVVCQNTLNMSLRQIKAQVLLRHTKNVHTRLLDTGSVLGLADQEFLKVQSVFQELANTRLSTQQFADYVEAVYTATGENPNQRTLDHRESVEELFNSPTNMTPGLAHTAYSATQSVIEYVDHFVPMNQDTNRAEEALFGRGARVKEKAINVAADMFLK